MNKSVFAAMSSILVLSAALAGCGGGDNKAGEQGGQAANEENRSKSTPYEPAQ